jgi:hypothetical protein
MLVQQSIKPVRTGFIISDGGAGAGVPAAGPEIERNSKWATLVVGKPLNLSQALQEDIYGNFFFFSHYHPVFRTRTQS